MMSTRMTAARRTVAVAAAALLFAAGCDDGAQESAPPEAPAEQGAEGAGEEAAGGESSDAEQDDAEGDAEQDDAEGDSDAQQDDEGGEESGEVEEISETPCADLTPEDVGAVVGNEVGDREDTVGGDDPVRPDDASIIACRYMADTVEEATASLYWIPPMDDLPEEMPEEARERHDESRARQLLGDGEEIEVAGASAATVEITTALGIVQVTIRAAVGASVLTSSLVAGEGHLDESDIPTAVELAELAISVA